MFLDWKYVKEEEASMLEECRSQEEVGRVLYHIFIVKRDGGVNSSSTKKNHFIELNFHVQNYSFCKAAAFDLRKTSTFLSVMKEILDTDTHTEAILRSPERSIALLEKYLVMHSVERPPKSIQIFNRSDVVAIMNFCLNRYYRNFHLFNYIFGVQTNVKLKQVLRNQVEEPAQSFVGLSQAQYKETTNSEPIS